MIYLLIGLVAEIIIKRYYFHTWFEKIPRRLSIKGVERTWILIVLLVFGLLFISFTEMNIIGFYLISRVSIDCLILIRHWLHDRKNY